MHYDSMWIYLSFCTHCDKVFFGLHQLLYRKFLPAVFFFLAALQTLYSVYIILLWRSRVSCLSLPLVLRSSNFHILRSFVFNLFNFSLSGLYFIYSASIFSTALDCPFFLLAYISLCPPPPFRTLFAATRSLYIRADQRCELFPEVFKEVSLWVFSINFCYCWFCIRFVWKLRMNRWEWKNKRTVATQTNIKANIVWPHAIVVEC